MTDLVALTQERLKYLLRYEASTGEFFWIRGRGPVAKPETKAGFINKFGYALIKVDGVNYRAHHLAWLYMTGVWPSDKIDHRDMVKSNNRFDNLREATHAQNQQNCGRQKNNKSGYKGVSFRRANSCWIAYIGSNGQRYFLGEFPTPQEAHAAYAAKAAVLHGEFARVA